MNRTLIRTLTVAAALAGLACTSYAQPRDDQRGHEMRRAPPAALHLDSRYRHNLYYPSAGRVVPILPGGSLSVAFGGGSWYFHAGVWYRPYGSRFVVAVPPFGIIVPLLPPAFVTLWIGGAPYYYANGVYYAPAPTPGYVVVAPPPGADTAQPAAPAPPPTALPEPIVYPRNNQTPAQTAADRAECQRWAASQPGAQTDVSVQQRGLAACLDARGYTVR